MNIKMDEVQVAGRAVLRRLAQKSNVQPDECCFDLPGLRLKVHVNDANYTRLCTRALVSGYPNTVTAPKTIDVHVLEQSHEGEASEVAMEELSNGFESTELSTSRGEMNWSYDAPHKVWQFFDPASGLGTQVMAEFSRMAPWEASFPLRRFLLWAYPSIGMQLIHAGSLGVGREGVLLAGSGGAGKSGTTLAGVANGLTSVGDDYIALDMSGEVPKTYPIVRLMKQDRKGLERAELDPKERDLGEPNWQNKYEFDFADLMPTARTDVLNMRAILIPRVTGAERTNLVPASAREAMLAIAPSNMAETMQTGLADCARLARRLPAYFVNLSADAKDVAGCIRNFIEVQAWSK